MLQCAHLPSSLSGESLYKGLHAVICQHGGVVDELVVAVLLVLDGKAVWHQRVPMVELVEFHSNAVPVLELHPKKELWIELQAQVVATEMLDIVFNYDFDGLTWEEGKLWVHLLPRVKQAVFDLA